MPVDLSSLEPAPLWSRFAEICAIPHPSGGEERLADKRRPTHAINRRMEIRRLQAKPANP